MKKLYKRVPVGGHSFSSDYIEATQDEILKALASPLDRELEGSIKYFDELRKEDFNPYINMDRFKAEYKTLRQALCLTPKENEERICPKCGGKMNVYSTDGKKVMCEYGDCMFIRELLLPITLNKDIEEAINSVDRLLNTCKLEFDEMPESIETEMFEVELSSYKDLISKIKQAFIEKDEKIERQNKRISNLNDTLEITVIAEMLDLIKNGNPIPLTRKQLQSKMDKIYEVVNSIAEDYLISMGEESKRRLAIKIRGIIGEDNIER